MGPTGLWKIIRSKNNKKKKKGGGQQNQKSKENWYKMFEDGQMTDFAETFD